MENDNLKKENLIDIDITNEVKDSFLAYSMSVIVSRALPDIRDGLKPVHRRIIYSMSNLNMFSNTAYKKSARIVGEVIGKYHPHGDSSVYDAMVKMAQYFSYNHPLIDGQGNFGSLDGDMPAAMRYTEARLSKISNLLVKNIDKNTVNFSENYDSSEVEPNYLPCYFPNLLINGAYGIAVGMATNIPPHNLNEVTSAVIELSKNPDITTRELISIIKGPDFPTGGLLMNSNELFKVYDTGVGTIKIRSKIKIEEINKRKHIIVTEIPYRVNKAFLLEKIALLVKNKKIMDISELRDESNREGVRIVIKLKKDSQENVVLNNLYKTTPLQINFSFNMIALENNKPKLLSLKEILNAFIKHRINIIIKSSKFDYSKHSKKLFILQGLITALDNIDKIINIIKNSETNKVANEKLKKEFSLTSEQSTAILEMKLQRLTGLEKNKIKKEIDFLKNEISKLEEIINNKNKQFEILRKEQIEIRNKFSKDRLTEISDEDINIENESLIKKENFVIVLSRNGYVKSIRSKEITEQNRGGKGSRILNKDFDVFKIICASSLDDLLFVTNLGKIHRIKTYKIPKHNSRDAKGLPINNLINLEKNEKIRTIVSISKERYKNDLLVFVTENGFIKKVALKEFKLINNNGKKAIVLEKDDKIVKVFAYTENEKNNSIFIGLKNSNLACFNIKNVKTSGRTAKGVIGIRNKKNNPVVSACCDDKTNKIFFVSETGVGKIVNSKEFSQKGRGGKGVKSMNLTDKTGNLKCILPIKSNEDILLITKKGFIIRIKNKNIPSISRTASGVKLITLNSRDKIQYAETIKN